MQDVEMAIIVDKHDKIIEFRDRRQVGKFDLHRIVSVWLTNSKGQVLIARRAYNMRNQPGLWGPAAAGTVSKDESYVDTAYRELEEEIGITGVKLEQTGKFMTDKKFGESRMCAVFSGAFNGSISNLRLQKEEVSEVCWISFAILKQELKRNPEQFVINMKQVVSCI